MISNPIKKILLPILVVASASVYAQSNTEVYLVDIVKQNDKIELVNLKNVSNNEGYDNQPSFYDDGTLIFSSARNGQTDIASYKIGEGKTSWVSNTLGSEYSPLKIPDTEDISSIRSDTNGLQRLYRYDRATGTSEVLLKNLKVGYHIWHSTTVLVTSVLVEDRMNLVVSNLMDNTDRTVYKNVGRSLHKIPKLPGGVAKPDLISFMNTKNDSITIMSLDPISGATETIKTLPIKIQDMAWLDATTILIPDGKIIAKLDVTTGNISVLHLFEADEINEISRMAVSPDGSRLALVSEESPAIIVQNQVEAFNAADLNAFASCFSEDVIVLNYPNDTLYTGNDKLKSGYERFFANNPKTSVEVVTRIKKKNVVIDEERVMMDGKVYRQAAIYQIKNGKIMSMAFVHPKEYSEDVSAEAVTVVEQQLQAFNARDIAGFLTPFSKDVKVYNFPNKLTSEGQEALKAEFSQFFSKTPDLHSKIVNRINIGNTVIDDELLTVNGEPFNSVAIYEIEDGEIVRMTSVR